MRRSSFHAYLSTILRVKLHNWPWKSSVRKRDFINCREMTMAFAIEIFLISYCCCPRHIPLKSLLQIFSSFSYRRLLTILLFKDVLKNLKKINFSVLCLKKRKEREKVGEGWKLVRLKIHSMSRNKYAQNDYNPPTICSAKNELVRWCKI